MKQKLITKLSGCLLFMFFTASHSMAQTTTKGTDFWLSFPENTYYRPTYYQPNRINLELKVAAETTTTVRLTFTDNSSLNTSFTVQGGRVYTHVFTTDQIAAVYCETAVTGNPGDAGYETKPKSLHITSTTPVSVYALTQANQSTDATNVLPVTNWGTDYYLISYPPYPNRSPISLPHDPRSGYLLIAHENGTIISENGTVKTTLNKGQVYLGYIFRQDMTGRHITSNKPVACFSMVSYTQIPNGSQYADVMFQQLAPVCQWGRNFIVPLVQKAENRIRVLASQNGTNITVSGITGTPITDTGGKASLSNLDAGEFVELKLTKPNGCYISSNKPVGVCAYMTSAKMNSDEQGDPAQSWIASVGQRERNILVAPFVPKGKPVGGTALTDHYAVIVTPTATKDQTTINSNPISGNGVNWVDVPNSGYSFFKYQMADGYSYLFSNPQGVVVNAYGLGTDESYYYLAGSGAIDLAIDFTVNDEDYEDMDGKFYCPSIVFEFKTSFIGGTPSSIIWKLNGNEISGSRNNTTVSGNHFADGDYTLTMTFSTNAGVDQTLTTHFSVGIIPVIWTPEANAGATDAQKQDWDIVANWTPAIVPTACQDVYIPGNSTHYPCLTTNVTCNDIYFMQGGELGRPDLLTYNQVYVHFNVGLKQSPQEKETTTSAQRNLILAGNGTSDRLKFSASTSQPLERERWYALSVPLRNVVSGDLGFGGFPLTFMKKFGPVTKEGVTYPVGNWTTPYTSMVETLDPTEGFGFYMYGYGNSSGNNNGCVESGIFADLNEMTYLPSERNGHSYGIKRMNGILELPFFTDSLNMEGHRTQTYDEITRQSTFYYISDGTLGTFNTLEGGKETLVREDHKGNNRFTAETYSGGNWVFQNPIYHRGTGLSSGDEILVGNPYMSSIDMVEFCKDNASSIEPEFHMWNGSTFDTYSVDTVTGTVTPTIPGNSRYVAPLQGFFLTYKNGDIRFDVTKVSTVRPAGSASTLRSAVETGEEENILRIKAGNKSGVSYMLIGRQDGASNQFLRGEDVQKLFSPYENVPEIYALAGETPVDINYIGSTGEVTVPIGIKTRQLGIITLTFTGMNHCSPEVKIVFIDRLLNRKIELDGQSSFTYTFDNRVEGVQNDRFLIRFQPMNTSLVPLGEEDRIQVYPDISGIVVTVPSSGAIRQVQLYDMQGRVLCTEMFSGVNHCRVSAPVGIPQVIVHVVTDNQQTSKIIALTR